MSEQLSTPRHEVTGIIADPSRAGEVVDALHGAGFGEDEIRLLCGPEAREALDDHHGDGLLGRLAHAIEHFGAEGGIRHEAVQALDEGQILVGVAAQDDAVKRQVVDALPADAVGHLRYWTRFEVEDILRR
ncbi:hypothetical protein [Euzebya tangerina]|uniref:hypothetical protein n=1 Tax=Euzebya tangerina TaxID=591198 RepID=UPI00196B315A|nr:hypothetical protein [Euzebya tangerina]